MASSCGLTTRSKADHTVAKRVGYLSARPARSFSGPDRTATRKSSDSVAAGPTQPGYAFAFPQGAAKLDRQPEPRQQLFLSVRGIPRVALSAIANKAGLQGSTLHETRKRTCGGQCPRLPFSSRQPYCGRIRPVILSDHPKPASDYHLKTGQRE